MVDVLSSLRLALLLVFFALPLLEIMLLIKAGEVLGFWPTISLLIAAAVLGFLVIREQGLSMVSRMLGAMNEGKLPFEPMLDSYALITAGFLLIVPGFLTDAIGLLLLIEPVRRWGIRRALSGLAANDDARGSTGTRRASRPTIIEADYERLDEKDDGRRGGSGKTR
jgi:UPF0716 protein FxsA